MLEPHPNSKPILDLYLYNRAIPAPAEPKSPKSAQLLLGGLCDQTSENLTFSSIQRPIKAIIITVNTSDHQPIPELPNPPALCRLGVGVIGIIVAVSALPWIWFSLDRFGGFAWGLFGFELLTAVAGVFAILFAMGKFKEGWAIGVTAIAGSILVALVFGLYIDFIMSKKTDFPDIYPLAKYTFLARGAIIAALFALASFAVFVRDSRSISYIIKAALCAAPLAAIVAVMYFNFGPGVWINSTLSNANKGSGALQSVLGLSIGLLFIILISAAGHLLIRAYECGRPADPQSE